ncbi:MAG: hypothetical protein QUV07_10975 [Cyanobium sp. CZS 25K]|nr:hypothetical protein [Cyanobium sp. CZS25K]
MPPLFACSSCGVQIERSTRSYLQHRGRVLCSTCLDRLEAAGDAPTGPAGESNPAPQPGPG